MYEPLVRVDFLTQESCYVTCSQSPDLFADGNSNTCTDATSVDCGFRGGVGKIRLVTKLNVQVAPENAPPKPTITWIADGVPTTVSPDKVVDRTTDLTPYYSVVLPVPQGPVADLLFHVELVDGYEAEASGFSVSPPTVSLIADGCIAGETCARPAGVGKLPISILAPEGLVGAKLLQWLDDEPFGTVLEPASALTQDGVTEWRASPTVPVRENGIWRIQALVGSTLSPSQEIVLAPPDIRVNVLNCPANAECSLSAGSPVTLLVSAPRDIVPTSATLKSTLDGIPVAGTNVVDLSTVEGDSRTGYFMTTVPMNVGKVWQHTATINESTSDPGQAVSITPATQ